MKNEECSLIFFSHISSLWLLNSILYSLRVYPASIVASIMVLGSVITSLLYAIFDARSYSAGQFAGMILITVATLVLWYVASRAKVQKEVLPQSR